ncbi:MAG: hypothetical protein RIG84_09125 [Roseovarius sp.]
MTEKDIDALTKRIILPSLPVSDEEMARATHQDKGQKLARQDRWQELSRRIRYADEARLTTPGGETASLLLAYGARSDIVAAAEDALYDGAEPLPDGIEALEEVLEEVPGDYACALVVALAHLDIAWAWHSIAFEKTPEKSLQRAHGHLDRAGKILAPYDGQKLDAPSLLAAHCALAATNDTRGPKLAEDYAKLIELDPQGHRHMRELGRHMAQHLRLAPNGLEVAARRTAMLTREIWQSGGYTWTYLDALTAEPAALNLLDPEFFIEGMEQIITRKRDQHVINQFAAFCAISMAPRKRETPLSRRADDTRAELHDCLDWILSDYMQELHPLIWSQTLLAPGQITSLPSRRALVVKGRQTALRIIAMRFASEIADGSSIAFSPQGMYRLPAL